MDWGTILTIAITVATTRFWMAMKAHMALPFKFKCKEPGCIFSISASSAEGLSVVTKTHQEASH